MGRYSFDFKMKVVNEYLQGLGGYRVLSEKYNLADQSQDNAYKKRIYQVRFHIRNRRLPLVRTILR